MAEKEEIPEEMTKPKGIQIKGETIERFQNNVDRLVDEFEKIPKPLRDIADLKKPEVWNFRMTLNFPPWKSMIRRNLKKRWTNGRPR